MFKLKPNEFARTLDPLETTIYRGGAEIITPLVNEWRALCAEGICHQPFYQPEWIQCYVQAFAADQTLLLLTVRRQGKLRAVLPLIEERSTFHGLPVNKLRSASNVHSCRFDIVQGKETDPNAILLALWQQLKQLPNWHVIELLDVPCDGNSKTLLDLAQQEGFCTGVWEMNPGSYLTIPPDATTGEQAMVNASPKLRAELRAKKRRLEKLGKLAMHCYEQPDEATLEMFYRLEASGWKGQAGTAIRNHETTQQFYQTMVAAMSARNILRLYCLELDGKVIAAQLGLLHEGRYFDLKPAYDEAFRRHSPGHILMAEIVHDLASKGAQEIDFLGALDTWKLSWSKTVRGQGHCYIFRPGILGACLYRYKFQLLAPLRQCKKEWQARRAQPQAETNSKHGNQHSATHLSQDSPRNSHEEKLCR